MIRCGGTARESEFRQRGLSRSKNIFGLEPRPDRIESLEPVEEIGILCGGDSARESLIKMMVRVDQARQDDMTRQVDDFIGGGWKCAHRSDFFDEAAADEHAAFGDFGLAVVHSNDMGVFDEEGGHGV